MSDDPRVDAARYLARKAAREAGFDEHERGDAGTAPERTPVSELSPVPEPSPAPEPSPVPEPVEGPGAPTAHERALYVESAIQQAIRRGEFDDLPGYGKPLEGLGDHHDPDWWIRRKIQTEQLSGLGPPALRLRVEHAEFEERLDALHREQDVREYVEDFNRRVIDARRQLMGGPPVVTPTRDPDVEVAAWRGRHKARASAEAEQPRRRWFRRAGGPGR